jgi:hypothetical protein
MKGYWAIAALLVLCSTSTRADDKTQSVSTIGTGTFSCAKFAQYDAAPNNSGQMNLIVQWVWGFISAYNLRAAFAAKFEQNDAPNPAAPRDANATLLFIRGFCEKNPRSNVIGATLGLIGESGGVVSSSVTLQ